MGGRPVEVDIAPLRAAAKLLYEGPWVAERTVAAEEPAENAARRD
jgi:allophanate hydrolase